MTGIAHTFNHDVGPRNHRTRLEHARRRTPAILRYAARTPQLIVMATLQMYLFFLIYRYMFGGAIHAGSIPYVDYLVPGFVATGVLFSGIGAAVATAEDLEQGFVDRLRSLPMPPRLFVRRTCDGRTPPILALASAVTVAITFAVGLHLHGSSTDQGSRRSGW